MLRPFMLLTLLLLAAGCSFEETAPPSTATPPGRIEPLATQHLPNAVRIHERVLSGGLPEGEAAFAELQSLGVKTLISVDGARPDVALAERFGLRYVHLPHGYDGIPQHRARELAKAVRDLPGPVYIHCHHGHHRSPAAAAVACVGAGLISQRDGATVLSVGGTSEHYRGLFESVELAHPLDQALLDEFQCDFPSTAQVPALAEAMVAMEHVTDHLKAMERGRWRTPSAQPDLVGEHEALLLREHYTELLRTSDVRARPEEFQQLMLEGERLAQSLETTLQIEPINAAAASALLHQLTNQCQSCHQRFRDVPIQRD